MSVLFTILAFAAGLFILWLICKLLAISIKIFWKLLINALCGAAILLLINLFGGLIGLSIAITPLNSLITGVLGVPGVILILVLQWLL